MREYKCFSHYYIYNHKFSFVAKRETICLRRRAHNDQNVFSPFENNAPKKAHPHIYSLILNIEVNPTRKT